MESREIPVATLFFLGSCGINLKARGVESHQRFDLFIAGHFHFDYIDFGCTGANRTPSTFMEIILTNRDIVIHTQRSISASCKLYNVTLQMLYLQQNDDLFAFV